MILYGEKRFFRLVSMNGNRIPDYDIADIVPEYTGFTQDVKTQQQKQDSREKSEGGLFGLADFAFTLL